MQNVWARCVSSGGSFDYRAEISLPDNKADAMFELLKPSDIAVKVGRRRDGVVVIGTEKEIQTLRRFAQSLTRYQGMSRSSMESCLLRDGYERRPADSFELPPEKRCALFHILAYDDVPILVSGGHGKIHIAASEDDREIVHNVVDILRGKRLVEPCMASR